MAKKTDSVSKMSNSMVQTTITVTVKPITKTNMPHSQTITKMGSNESSVENWGDQATVGSGDKGEDGEKSLNKKTN